jgi:hypothetical protein
MKKVFRFTLCLLLMASLFCGLGFAAFAESSVNFEGGAENFIFLPGSRYTSTDLFENFKDVMPGDVIDQEIKIKNNFLGPDTIKIYMRAIPHDESNPLSASVAAEEDLASMTDFLSQLHMEIYDKKGELIYSASPDELGGLTERLLLVELGRGQSATFTVRLIVPIELGNEYADRVGEVDWEFLAEVIPPAPPAGPVPVVPHDEVIEDEEVPLAQAAQTGSFTPILLALCIISGFGIILLNVKKKQKEY